jgi:hypothetical protein
MHKHLIIVALDEPMSNRRYMLGRVMTAAIFILPLGSLAQSLPTATQALQLSTFIAATRTSTDLESGENLDITSGMDLMLLALRRLDIAGELRGSYPVQRGSADSQESFVSGPKIEYPLHNIRPYVDFMVGRGRITYLSGGYIFRNIKYIRSDSLVLSPGIGLDFYLSHRVALKVDFQYQSWNTPAAVSGRIAPGAAMVGATYHFDFNARHPE